VEQQGFRNVSATLVIVPCGGKKIWSREPKHGTVPAKDAYIGTYFSLNRECAERFADHWVILSAKYGFIDPDFSIPGPYDVTFSRKATGAISVEALRLQAQERGLSSFTRVIGLGGKDYRRVITRAFDDSPVTPTFPFAEAKGIGYVMEATRKSLNSDSQ
jgi:hypothetical protein